MTASSIYEHHGFCGALTEGGHPDAPDDRALRCNACTFPPRHEGRHSWEELDPLLALLGLAGDQLRFIGEHEQRLESLNGEIRRRIGADHVLVFNRTGLVLSPAWPQCTASTTRRARCRLDVFNWRWFNYRQENGITPWVYADNQFCSYDHDRFVSQRCELHYARQAPAACPVEWVLLIPNRERDA